MGKYKFAIWGVVLAIIVYWAWPEAQEEALAYESAEACIRAGESDPETCRSEFDKAKGIHESTAPRYRSANQCQSDFGYISACSKACRCWSRMSFRRPCTDTGVACRASEV